METKTSHDLLEQFSEFVARRTGLNYPPERWTDLERGIVGAAKVMNFEDTSDCVRSLMASTPSKAQLSLVVQQLTVGETYFFREIAAFRTLEQHIIPLLVRQRANGERRLRIWSAACCTGEEAYSIAITLRKAIPDWREWDLHLLATDINPQYLTRAESGRFGNWSFRGTPAWLKEQFFRPVGKGQFEISPEIRRMVRFEELNLAEDVYPSHTNGTEAMDVIFCRNVLMYFAPQQAAAVLGNLYRAQVDGGCLFVSPSELLHVSATPYISSNLSGAMFHRKLQSPLEERLQFPKPISGHAGLTPQLISLPQSEDSSQSIDESSESATNLVVQESEQRQDPGDLARSLANLGMLAEALSCCDQWILADRLNPSAHYFRAVVLQEQGKTGEAAKSLKSALYLDPKFPLAHFAMSSIARRQDDLRMANKHLRNAMEALQTVPSDEILCESDGMTAGRLREIIGKLSKREVSA